MMILKIRKVTKEVVMMIDGNFQGKSHCSIERPSRMQRSRYVKLEALLPEGTGKSSSNFRRY
jgi:hypothetical protein